MYTKQPKKLLIMNILDILKKYTDQDHRLSQKEIVDILKTEYNMTADRKSVRRNILNLMDCGYEIEYSETIRLVPNKDGEMQETYIWSDFYLVRDFTDGELRMLIDGLLFSNHIPYSQCRKLAEKLEGLSNIYFKSRLGHIATLDNSNADNKQVFYNIELLDEAISKHKKISFKYCEYDTDKKIHLRKRPDGSVREYVINPYQMVAKEGKYYLICNYDKYDDISNYRIDRICDLKILDEQAKSFEKLRGASGRKLNLSDYMQKHIYMFSSDNIHTRFRISKVMVSDVIDMFGKDIKFSEETENDVVVSAFVNEMAMLQFAKNFAPYVIVLEPQSLANKVKKDLEEAIRQYIKIN